MYLVEIFLPVKSATKAELTRLTELLTARFGGATAFGRAPGEGFWRDAGDVVPDQIIVVETMCADLDRKWWSSLRADLERRLHEQAVLVRSHAIEGL